MNTIDRVQTGLRLDRNIYKQLKANAKKNRQTFNKYVEEVLKNFLDDDSRASRRTTRSRRKFWKWES